jgi:hypothetical protein
MKNPVNQVEIIAQINTSEKGCFSLLLKNELPTTTVVVFYAGRLVSKVISCVNNINGGFICVFKPINEYDFDWNINVCPQVGTKYCYIVAVRYSEK